MKDEKRSLLICFFGGAFHENAGRNATGIREMMFSWLQASNGYSATPPAHIKGP